MGKLTRHVVDVATIADGSGTGYTPAVSGFVRTIRYVKDGTTPYAAGVDVTITAEISGAAIATLTNLDATGTYQPRVATHDTVGAAALYAAGGTAVNDLIPVAQERIKIVIAAGGDTKTGRFHVYVEGAPNP